MSDYLRKLKESVDNGKFNSDVANKFNQINEKADNFAKDMSKEEMSDKYHELINAKKSPKVSEEDLPEMSTNYSDKMDKIYYENALMKEISEIANLDDQITRMLESIKDKISSLKNKVEGYDEISKILSKFDETYSNINI